MPVTVTGHGLRLNYNLATAVASAILVANLVWKRRGRRGNHLCHRCFASFLLWLPWVA